MVLVVVVAVGVSNGEGGGKMCGRKRGIGTCPEISQGKRISTSTLCMNSI